jgi:hypothetical protein
MGPSPRERQGQEVTTYMIMKFLLGSLLALASLPVLYPAKYAENLGMSYRPMNACGRGITCRIFILQQG